MASNGLTAMRRIRVAVLVWAILVAVGPPGAIGVRAQDATDPVDPLAEPARIRLLNGAPGAPSLDGHVAGSLVIRDVPFGEASQYVEVLGGDSRVQVTARGKDPAGDALVDSTLTFVPGSTTTLAVVTTARGLGVQTVIDAPVPATDRTQLRILHLADDPIAVDLALDEGDVVVPGLRRPDATDWFALPPATYDLEVRGAGSLVAAYDMAPLILEAGTSWSAYAVGSVADGTFAVLPVVDADLSRTIARIRLLHGAPGSPAVDLYVDGTLELSEVPFGEMSDYLDLQEGTRQLRLVTAGAGPTGEAVVELDVDLLGQTWSTIAAVGPPTEIEARVLTEPPPAAPGGEGSRLRVVDLGADSVSVDIAPDGAKAMFTELEPSSVTGYRDLPAGDLDLDVRRAGAGKKDVAFDVPTVTLSAGASYSAWLVGSLDEETFTVLVVDDPTK